MLACVTSRLRRAGAVAAALAALALLLPAAASAAPPTVSVGPIPPLTEDAGRVFNMIVVSDDDGDPVRLRVTVGSGTLSASSNAAVVVTGSGTTSVSLTGTPSALNSYLSGSALVYTPAANVTGAVALSVEVTDDEGFRHATSTALTINAVNDAPTLTMPASFTTDQDRELQLTGVWVADIDAGSGLMTLTVRASGGGSVAAAPSGDVTVSPVSGGVSLTGTVNDLNALLAGGGLRYTPAAGSSAGDTLIFRVDDNGNTGSGGSLFAEETVEVTVVPAPPAVASIDALPLDGPSASPFGIGGTIAIRVRFSRAVTVATSGGSPVLLLATGRPGAAATYVTGSGGDTLTFHYTVEEGDASAALDYVSTAALQLGGATIAGRDAPTAPAGLTLPPPGAPGSLAAGSTVAVDGIRPRVTAFERLGPASVTGGTVGWELRFSEPVADVDAGAFALVLGGAPVPDGLGGGPVTGTLGAVTQVDPATWRVTATGVGGTGTIGLVLAAAGAVADAAGNRLAADVPGPLYAVAAPASQPRGPPEPPAGPLPVPEVRVSEAPPEVTRAREVRIVFAVDPAAAGYECRLDDGPWQRCGSPWTVAGLAPGDHVAEIRAVSADGRRGATVRRSFQVNPGVPGVRVGGGRVLKTARGGGRVALAIACSPREGAGRGRCAGSVRLMLAPPRGKKAVGTRLLGSAPFRAAAGRTATARVRLSPSARRTLARAGARGLRVRVVVDARDLAGNARTYSTARTLRLR